MQVVKSVTHYQEWRIQQQHKVAFVPTMGNLHAGHLSLVKKAQEYTDTVVVSIFINPLQFAPHEDFNSYPRTLAEDLNKLQSLGVNMVFTPTANEIYPHGKANTTQVIVPEVSKALCGASRPHFFPGVATVVCKLFNIIQPHFAVFGEKDFQQLLVIKKMVADLNLPIEVIGAPIARDQDGLALSSRNNYLTAEQKHQASTLYKTLQQIAKAIKAGGKISEAITKGKEQLLEAGFEIDYLEARSSDDLQVSEDGDENIRLFVAALFNKVRLIDNLSFG